MKREDAILRLLEEFRADPRFRDFFESQYDRLTDGADSIDSGTYKSIVTFIKKYFQ